MRGLCVQDLGQQLESSLPDNIDALTLPSLMALRHNIYSESATVSILDVW